MYTTLPSMHCILGITYNNCTLQFSKEESEYIIHYIALDTTTTCSCYLNCIKIYIVSIL